MTLLAFDTCNGLCSVALIRNGIIIGYQLETAISKQAEKLFPLIQEILNEHNLSYADLNAVALSVGPGSFTGVRIGIAAGLGIKFATQLPLIGVTCFEALAFNAGKFMAMEDYKTMVVLNARRGQLYMQIFDDKQALTTPAMLSYSDTLSNINDNKFLIIGDGTIFLQEKIANSDSQVIPELVRVDAKWVAFAAEKKYLSGCKAMIAPCYIREADAQIPIK